ncbi:hypothetical protein [Pseudoxanthomonas dokdonensis]|uniref:Secreted protein n=1 Tax=Pseudoxanthomonas dokdonensis TaxID=344882 RepID=A0A0R0CFU5_9GAMM|nr:hypothetical protein [Pseudoxanthomonas dokdonensis]KRG68171.1 hypothetical protein ABB29_14085 [Pseudoxanthomonas dokdonensis]
MQRILFASLISLAAIPAAHAAADCTALVASQPSTSKPTVLSPVSDEFSATVTQLGAPSGVLSQGLGEAQTVDRVLARIQLAKCQNQAALPAVPAVNANDAAAYKPKTEFDNTPWRFDMSQNGKRMTAEEFDAWMKSRGVRVAKGAAKPAAAIAPVAAPAAADAPAAAPAATPPADTKE